MGEPRQPGTYPGKFSGMACLLPWMLVGTWLATITESTLAMYCGEMFAVWIPGVTASLGSLEETCQWVCRWWSVLVLTFVGTASWFSIGSAHEPGNNNTDAIQFRPSRVAHFQQWVSAARATLQQVHDYECTFVKRERINGQLQEEHVAAMRVRSTPFSVYLKFTAPRSAQGREASFVSGRNQGKMRAKNGGALGLVGYVLIDPQDPRAMQGTRHAITEAGIANLVSQLEAGLGRMSSEGEAAAAATIQFAESVWAEIPCLVFQITDPKATQRDAPHRTLVYFDRNTNLPIRYEAYRPDGELLEYFGYHSLRFNCGLTDRSFP